MPGKGGRRGKCGKDGPAEYCEFHCNPLFSRDSSSFGERKRETERGSSCDVNEKKAKHVTRSTLLNYRFALSVCPSVRSFVPMIHPRGMKISYLFPQLPLPVHVSYVIARCWLTYASCRLQKNSHVSSLLSFRARKSVRERFSRGHGRHNCSHVTLMPLAHGVLTRCVIAILIRCHPHLALNIGILRIKIRDVRIFWERERENWI